MNYYIQGSPARAEEIKAVFEKLGYDISWPGGCANPDVINIGVERNGAKYVVAETSEYIKDIIKTHPDYKELKLAVKSKFKVGNSLRQEVAEINMEREYWQHYRIQAAIAAMQAELSNPNNTFMMCEDKRAIIVRRAVGYADALIAELQKKGGQDGD